MKKNRKIEFWIVTSFEDIASTNIRKYLLDNFSFEKCLHDEDPCIIWEGNESYILNFDELPELNIRIVTTNKRMVYLDFSENNLTKTDILNQTRADFTIFASKHRAKSNKPALLTHTTGIWNDNTEFGDNARSVANSSSMLLKAAYKNLDLQNKLNNLNWPVDLEVNHHGPTGFSCPIIFMELGSTEIEWNNGKAIQTISQAIIQTITDYMNALFREFHLIDYLNEYPNGSKKPNVEELKVFLRKQINQFDKILDENFDEIPTKNRNCKKNYENNCDDGNNKNCKKRLYCLGFGGPHYASNFSMIYSINKQVTISHIVPKYYILDLKKDQIQMMIDNTIEPINTFIIDWRGINSEGKKYLVKILEEFDIPIKKAKELRRIDK